MPPRSTPPEPPPQQTEERVTAAEITASQAAERLGLTKQAIGLWCMKPGAPVRKEGTRVLVRWPDFARWREQELVSSAKKATPEGSFGERQAAADARRAEIAMERAELELARELGQSVAVADFEEALGAILDLLCARLRGLSVRLESFGPHVEAAIEQEVERLIVELHRWDEDVVHEDDEPATDAAA